MQRFYIMEQKRHNTKSSSEKTSHGKVSVHEFKSQILLHLGPSRWAICFARESEATDVVVICLDRQKYFALLIMFEYNANEYKRFYEYTELGMMER